MLVKEAVKEVLNDELGNKLENFFNGKYLTNNHKEYLKSGEAAKYLKCSTQTIRNRFNTGELKGFKNGTNLIFLRKDLDDFLKKSKNFVHVKDIIP